MHLWSVVVAAGSGRRFGGLKQLADLGGDRVIDRSVAAVEAVSDGVVVVGDISGLDSAVVVVPGGATRSDSVRRGLAAVGAEATHVLVHDAARPLVPSAVVKRVVAALRDGASAVVPVVPVVDSLRTVEGQPVDRKQFVAVQTPQGFELDVLRQAHASGIDASDDATLVDRFGGIVTHVPGDPLNMKITGPADMAVAETLLEQARR